MQLSAVASLAVASTRRDGGSTAAEIGDVVEAVQRVLPLNSVAAGVRHTRILWVDDRPENNVYERRAFEAVGLTIRTALSTQEALEILASDKYAAVISDMGRKEGPREGYVLLDRLRADGDHTPFFIYAGSNSEAHKREASEHDGQGSTNDPQELFQMVTKSIFGARSLREGDFSSRRYPF
jgi:CheY-like chemotaxis protein